MSSSESNSNSAPPEPPEGPHRSSSVMLIVVLALLAILVWAMAPGRTRLAPAPLRPVPADCPKNLPDFVPTDATEIPGFDLHVLTTQQRNHVLFRLNMEPCPCGCNLSIAACQISHPTCPVSKGLVERILSEERQEPNVTPGK